MSENEEAVNGYAANFADPGLRQKVRHSTHPAWEKVFKRMIDIVAASLFIVIHSWLYLILWLGVRYTTGSPAIYSHRRVGRGGKEFNCLKFRSMLVNSAEVLDQHLKENPEAKAEWERDFKLRDDPRITKFGRIIRKTSLDELPQFWNVLRGEMSLVGPRPVIAQELERYYGGAAIFYSSVRPGITGPWQVGGRNDLGYDERVRLDVGYARNWSLVGDLLIVAKTFAAVITRRGSY